MEKLRLANEEETIEIAKKLWVEKDMQDYVVKKYDYYFTNDGLILDIEKVKNLPIEKTIWYDDETEAPTNNEDTFINYNMNFNNPMRNLENYIEECNNIQTKGYASGRYDYKGIYFRTVSCEMKTMVNCNWFDEKDKYFVRYLTSEEQACFIKLMQDRKAQYFERLKKYYKRYSKNVYVNGYWANR